MMDTPAKERNEPSYSSAHIFSNPALQGVAYTYIRLIHSFAYWVDRGSFNVLNSIFNKLNRDEASLITGLILLPFYLFGFLVEKTRCIIAATFFALSLVVFSLTLTAISTVGAIFSNLSNILLKPFNLDRKSLSTLEIINNMIWATIIDTCWYTFTASPQKIAAFFNNFYSRFILKKESRGTEEEDLNPPKYSFQQIMSILHAFVHFVSVVPPSSVYALLFYGKNNQETGLSKIIDHFINTPEAELKNADVFHLIKEWTLILSEQNPQPIVTILQNMKKHHLEALAQLVEIDGISNREIINCISEIKSPYWDTKSHTALQNFFKNILVIANAVDEKTSQLSLPLTSSAQFDILELALQQTQKITPVLHAAFTGPIGKLSVLFLRNSLENPPLSWPKERVQAISESITALQKKIQLNDLIELIAFFRTLLTELKKYNIRSLDQIITLSLDQRLQLIDTVLNNLSPRLIELFFLLDMSLIELALNALTDRTQSSELITRQEEFNRHTINQLKSLQKSYHENKTSWKSKYNATIKAIRLHINNINSHPDYWKSVSTKALKDDLTRRFMQHKGFSAGAIQDCLDGKNSIANLALNCFNDILNDSTKQQAKINQIKTILYRTPIIAYELDIAIGIKNPITTEKLKKTLEDKEFISRFIKERYPESRHDSLHEQIHRILSLLPDNSSESCIGDIRELCQLTFGTEEFATLEQSILVNDFNAPPINTKAQPILEINTDLAQRILCVLYHNDHHDNINQFIKEHPANLTKDVLLNKYGQDGAIIFDFLSTANEAEINLLEKELEVAKYDLSHRRLQSVLYRNPGMKLATLELSPTLLTPILDGTQFSNLQELLRVLHDNFSNNLYEYEALNTIFNNGNIKFDSEPSLKNRLGFFQSFTNTISTASDLIAFENTELTNETRVEKQQYLLAEAQERYSLQWSRDYSNQPTYNEHALLIQLISNERSRSFLEPLNHIYPGLRDRLNQIAYSEIQSITASKNWEESIAQEFGAMAVLSLKHQLACIHKEIQESVSIDTCKDIPISIDIQELFKYKEILQTKSPTVQRFLREEIEKANTQRALLHVINGAVLGVNPPFIECMQISWTPNNATPMLARATVPPFPVFLNGILLILRDCKPEQKKSIIEILTPIVIGLIVPKLALAEDNATTRNEKNTLKRLLSNEINQYTIVNHLLLHIDPETILIIQKYGDLSFVQFVLEQFYSYGNPPSDPAFISRLLHYVMIDPQIDAERASRLCKAIALGNFPHIMAELTWNDFNIENPDSSSYTQDTHIIHDLLEKDLEGVARIAAKSILTVFPPKIGDTLDQCIDKEQFYTEQLLKIFQHESTDLSALLNTLSIMLIEKDRFVESVNLNSNDAKIRKDAFIKATADLLLQLKALIEFDPTLNTYTINPLVEDILESDALIGLITEAIPHIVISDEGDELCVSSKLLKNFITGLQKTNFQSIEKEEELILYSNNHNSNMPKTISVLSFLLSNLTHSQILNEKNQINPHTLSSLTLSLLTVIQSNSELQKELLSALPKDFHIGGHHLIITEDNLQQVIGYIIEHPEMLPAIYKLLNAYSQNEHGFFFESESHTESLTTLLKHADIAHLLALLTPDITNKIALSFVGYTTQFMRPENSTWLIQGTSANIAALTNWWSPSTPRPEETAYNTESVCNNKTPLSFTNTKGDSDPKRSPSP